MNNMNVREREKENENTRSIKLNSGLTEPSLPEHINWKLEKEWETKEYKSIEIYILFFYLIRMKKVKVLPLYLPLYP